MRDPPPGTVRAAALTTATTGTTRAATRGERRGGWTTPVESSLYTMDQRRGTPSDLPLAASALRVNIVNVVIDGVDVIDGEEDRSKRPSKITIIADHRRTSLPGTKMVGSRDDNSNGRQRRTRHMAQWPMMRQHCGRRPRCCHRTAPL